MEHCQACGKEYLIVYSVPDEVWERITPKKDEAGLLCVECANQRAWGVGISLYWSAGIGGYPEINQKLAKRMLPIMHKGLLGGWGQKELVEVGKIITDLEQIAGK